MGFRGRAQAEAVAFAAGREVEAGLIGDAFEKLAAQTKVNTRKFATSLIVSTRDSNSPADS